MSVSIEVRIVRNKLNQLPSRLKTALREQVLLATALAIEQDVKGRGPHAAPIRTGNLRRSYHHRWLDDWIIKVSSDPSIAPYAVFVELGTRKMRPRPHLGPATEAQVAEIPQRLRAVRDALAK